MKEQVFHTRRNFIRLLSAGGLLLTAGSKDRFFGDTTSGEKKFVPVMITPFNSSSGIDYDGLSRLIEFYAASGAKGFFANCLSSEMYALEPGERLALARHVVKQVNGRYPVVASGSFGQTPAEQVEFTKKMSDTGVNAVILITSHFAAATDSDDRLIENFEKFFAATGNIPVGTYECPSPYKRILNPAVFKYLLGTNRLVYHKDTTLDVEKIKEKLALARNSRLELYDAHTPNATASLKAGAKGISAIAGNFYPEIFSWLCSNVTNDKRAEDVSWIQSELTRIDPIISDNYPLSAKYFLQKRGLPLQLICRTNKTALTTRQQEALDTIFKGLPAWHERLGIKKGS